MSFFRRLIGRSLYHRLGEAGLGWDAQRPIMAPTASRYVDRGEPDPDRAKK